MGGKGRPGLRGPRTLGRLDRRQGALAGAAAAALGLTCKEIRAAARRGWNSPPGSSFSPLSITPALRCPCCAALRRAVQGMAADKARLEFVRTYYEFLPKVLYTDTRAAAAAADKGKGKEAA